MNETRSPARDTVSKLAESEAELRLFADAMPHIAWTADASGAISYQNRRWIEYFGTETGTRWDTYVHPDDFPHADARWRAALASGDDYAHELRLRGKDGAFRWFLVRAACARDELGSIAHWHGTCTDIDRVKRADAALAVSRIQLAMVVEGADVGAWHCALPFDKLVWDDKVKQHFHLSPDTEVDIDLFYERIHPDDRERTRAAIESSIADKTAYDIDYRTVSADGLSIKWIRAKGRAFYGPDGLPLRFDGITLDVTKRAAFEQQLRESELRFRNMSDHAPVMIWMTRADGYCEYLNQRWYEFTGQTVDGALGFGWLDAVHPDDAERAGRIFREANESHVAFDIEYRLRRRDGAYRWCVDAAAPRFGVNGEFLGYIGSVIDITDRALAEQERTALLESERAARIEAERASRMKDEFLATLSHELRTPLNAIMGWAHILMTRTGGPEDTKKGLTVIERNARAQAQIIEDLLDMSRIISGKIRLDVARVDLAAIVHSAVETVRPAAEAKGIKLQVVVDSLRAAGIAGDESRLHQVLWNLLSNAVKFTPKGGRVQVLLERVNSHIEISVIDTGEGIAPEFLQHVFDRFRQADASSTRRHGGLGLGLAIVKQLVELHGGSVRARSAGLGAGSTFAVTLPVTPVHSEPEPREERTHPRKSSNPPPLPTEAELTGLNILVVDDEPDARALIKRLLEDSGARTAIAGSAREAWALLESERFDLLVSDIGMPVEDGYALIRRLRDSEPTQGPHLPAVALTAYARTEDRIRALRAGYQMHLVKPVEPAELLTVVASLTGRTGPD